MGKAEYRELGGPGRSVVPADGKSASCTRMGTEFFEMMVRTHRRKLRTGFTTGTAAAAAAKAAATLLMREAAPSEVLIALITGDVMTIPIHACTIEAENVAGCLVMKDAGDDPDITHRALIGARVRMSDQTTGHRISITGGQGVGTVTKPGLEVPPVGPAINPGPQKMIEQAVTSVLRQYDKNTSVEVEIFVPEGETLARKTLNARLGILGGISILGTTGLVRPMSHEAYIATIESSMSVAHAMGLDTLVLTTGRRSERFAQALWEHLPEESFIQIGDFFRASLEAASHLNFARLTLAVFFGKAVKMAQGIPHTHAAKSRLTMHKLADWSLDATKDEGFAAKILSASTARHAFDILREEHPEVISHVGKRMVKSARFFAGTRIRVRGIIFDYTGKVIFDSDMF